MRLHPDGQGPLGAVHVAGFGVFDSQLVQHLDVLFLACSLVKQKYQETGIRRRSEMRCERELVAPMKANPRQTTMSLGNLITRVYEQFGATHAEALIWFAIHGHPIFATHSAGAKIRDTKITTNPTTP